MSNKDDLAQAMDLLIKLEKLDVFAKINDQTQSIEEACTACDKAFPLFERLFELLMPDNRQVLIHHRQWQQKRQQQLKLDNLEKLTTQYTAELNRLSEERKQLELMIANEKVLADDIQHQIANQKEANERESQILTLQIGQLDEKIETLQSHEVLHIEKIKQLKSQEAEDLKAFEDEKQKSEKQNIILKDKIKQLEQEAAYVTSVAENENNKLRDVLLLEEQRHEQILQKLKNQVIDETKQIKTLKDRQTEIEPQIQKLTKEVTDKKRMFDTFVNEQRAKLKSEAERVMRTGSQIDLQSMSIKVDEKKLQQEKREAEEKIARINEEISVLRPRLQRTLAELDKKNAVLLELQEEKRGMEDEITLLRKKIRKPVSDEEIKRLLLETKEQQVEINRLKAGLRVMHTISRPVTGMKSPPRPQTQNVMFSPSRMLYTRSAGESTIKSSSRSAMNRSGKRE